MASDRVLDLGIAPAAALARIAAAINLPKKRALGIFKNRNEFVGFIREDMFEIWERQGRAVHAVGTVRARRGGTQLIVRIAVPRVTRVLIGLFFVLYAVAAVGIATQAPGTQVTLDELVIAVGGAAVIAAVFGASAWKQRADLRGLVDAVFGDVPRL
jgi:hypothetical protein